MICGEHKVKLIQYKVLDHGIIYQAFACPKCSNKVYIHEKLKESPLSSDDLIPWQR